jgi:TPR repeat protein
MQFALFLKISITYCFFMSFIQLKAPEFYQQYLKKHDIARYFFSYINKLLVKILAIFAHRGYKYAEYAYAHYLISRSETVTDIITAANWLEKSAVKGIAAAAYKLVVIMEQFDYSFLKQNNFDDFSNKITGFIIAAAEAGYSRAQYKLAMYYWSGKYNLPQDPALSHDWFTLAARKLFAKAFCNLGVMYNRGDLGEKDSAKAYSYFMAADALGDNIAPCNLAQMYRHGEYVPKNLQISFKYFKQSALIGSVEGMYELARCYEKGLGTEKDIKEAFYWYSRAVNFGSVAAKLKLADFYIYGNHVKANPIKAEYLLKSVAEHGDAHAQFKLGLFYDSTTSNLQSYQKAYEWYLKSAKQGYTKSQINLAALFLKGEGVSQSDESAKFWLELASQSGDQVAKYNLKQFKFAKLEEFVEQNLGTSRILH